MLAIRRTLLCLMNKKERQFVDVVWEYYRLHGRSHLPWRKRSMPYTVLVSELMLQQTQVDRVIPKYQAFMKRFPTVARLAAAPQKDVLTVWQGLGYNRRARYLQQAAQAVVQNTGFPKTYKELLTLPGVGPYTAGAIMAFAYNKPVVLIETNIRQVFLHHFFSRRDGVSDSEILQLVEKTLPVENPRDWYAALMDYGTYLKQINGNNTNKSAQYTKQSKFEGSGRQVRGRLLTELTTAASPLSVTDLEKRLSISSKAVVKEKLLQLVAEELVYKKGGRYYC